MRSRGSLGATGASCHSPTASGADSGGACCQPEARTSGGLGGRSRRGQPLPVPAGARAPAALPRAAAAPRPPQERPWPRSSQSHPPEGTGTWNLAAVASTSAPRGCSSLEQASCRRGHGARPSGLRRHLDNALDGMLWLWAALKHQMRD